MKEIDQHLRCEVILQMWLHVGGVVADPHHSKHQIGFQSGSFVRLKHIGGSLGKWGLCVCVCMCVTHAIKATKQSAIKRPSEWQKMLCNNHHHPQKHHQTHLRSFNGNLLSKDDLDSHLLECLLCRNT